MKKKTKIFLIIILIVIFAALLFALCGPVSPFTGIRKLYNKPQEPISVTQEAPELAGKLHITAHRGMNSLAPENTLPAYEKAIAQGYYSAECDIKQTSDGTWVLYHDPLLFTRFQKWGAVGDKDLATLKSYPYKTGTAFWEYTDVRIPTLDEYLDLFAGSKTRPQIEIKTSNYDSLGSVVEAVKAKGLEKSAIIISFDLEQLKEIRKYDSEIELWYLVYRINQKKIDEAKSLGNCWISADFDLNNEKNINLCLSQNVELSLWTVNSVKDAQKLYDMGIRYIETDILIK
ncbi:MAG: hypothetical protein E7517_07195 [Ruminococcaceae bacterium]|nr:hypothetical protein [Oscillospiraceae bacterium]